MTTVYAPNLTSPVGGEIFNKGKISITWETKNPPTSDTSITLSQITYEIEYTENFIGRETNWFTVKRRISGDETSFDWYVGKMLKSETLRMRIRAFCEDINTYSEYSPSAADFSVNVFKLVPPAILSPLPGRSYIDYINIIIDESQTINTYSQKIRYRIEYQSDDAGVDWTTLFEDLPVGSSPLRWNIDSLPTGTYQLKLTIMDANNDLSVVQHSLPSLVAGYSMLYFVGF